MPDDGPEPHPDLAPLRFLLGRWEGAGVGGYPTIESFHFGQEINFSHNGKPFLIYTSRSWLLDDEGVPGRPLGMETGFWRPQPEGKVEVVLAHPTGITEIYLGEVTGTKIEMATDIDDCRGADPRRRSGTGRARDEDRVDVAAGERLELGRVRFPEPGRRVDVDVRDFAGEDPRESKRRVQATAGGGAVHIDRSRCVARQAEATAGELLGAGDARVRKGDDGLERVDPREADHPRRAPFAAFPQRTRTVALRQVVQRRRRAEESFTRRRPGPAPFGNRQRRPIERRLPLEPAELVGDPGRCRGGAAIDPDRGTVDRCDRAVGRRRRALDLDCRARASRTRRRHKP